MKARKRTDTVCHYDLEALKRNLEAIEANIAICMAMGYQKSLDEELKSKAELLVLIREIENSDTNL